MPMRLLLASAALALGLPFAAEAQTRPQPNQPRFQPSGPGQTGRPGAAPGNPNANERHERAKTEAQDAYQKGDFAHALTLVESVLNQNPRDDVALYLRGSVKVEMGRRDRKSSLLREGIADTRQAITLKPRDNAIYYLPYLYGMSSLSQIENRPEHAEVAVKIAEQIVSTPSVKPEEKANIYYQLGVARNSLNQPEKAAKDFEEALKLEPNHLGAHMAAADAYVRAGKFELAENSYNQAVNRLSRNPLVYNNRGMFRQSRGDAAGAIEDYTRSIQLDDTFAVAYTNRGYTLLTMGNHAAAEADLTASLAINPNQDSVYSFRGAARLGQGKVDPAISDFTKLVERAPKNAVAWSDLGFARFFAKDYKNAARAFEQASGLGPNMKYLNPWRYWALSLSGAPEKTLSEFSESIGGKPAEGDWVQALSAYAVGKLSEEELLKNRNAQNPRLNQDQTCEAHFFAGLKLQQEGKTTEANEQFQKALESGSRHLSAFRGAQFALKKFEASEGT